ncbi:MAG: stage II sporulation protein D [Chitinophagales bacterium]
MRLSLSTILWFCLAVVIGVPVALVLGLSGGRPGPAPSEAMESISVYVEGQGLTQMALEDYVAGVVAAEVPALFEPEALKAQAVAARTYAVRAMPRHGGTGCDQHPGADVCTDIKHGQAWASQAELRRKWGFVGYLRLWRRVARAVFETRGQILTYQGKPIVAVYHSTCGGRTENAEEVWGTYVPYLRSVPCSWDKASPRYSETRRITIPEFDRLLGVNLAVPALSGNKANPLVILESDASGRVKEAMVAGTRFSGLELRERLSLRSTRFTWSLQPGAVEIRTTGNGHGVGLCQWGANGLAKLGRGYREILAYYYSGTAVQKLDTLE